MNNLCARSIELRSIAPSPEIIKPKVSVLIFQNLRCLSTCFDRRKIEAAFTVKTFVTNSLDLHCSVAVANYGFESHPKSGFIDAVLW